MEKEARTHYAICILNGIKGIVKFAQKEGEMVRVRAEIDGLTPGLHGFHVHEFGNLTNGCVSAGPHYNPTGKTHAGPTDESKHVGDFGNVVADENGHAVYDAMVSQVMIYGWENCIAGRACVVHQGVDDLGKGGNEESLKTGNAGTRVACGVIGISNPFELPKL